MKQIAVALCAVLALAGTVSTASAATTIVVTPAHSQGWVPADVRPGGEINFVSDTAVDAPYPPGALQLKTDNTNTAKAQYLHGADNLPLSAVTELDYWTKQVSGPVHADASYQLVVDLNGGTIGDGGFTTFVFEPYQNGVVVPGAWQQWDVDAGQMWSSRSFSAGTCNVVAGAGGPPFYTLAALQAACPNAVVLAFGVNVGTFNPGYDVETDGVTFNGVTYDFELTNEPADKDECKNGGWQSLTDGDGNAFKNQGNCVSYANHN
jgi:hypothetical protein